MIAHRALLWSALLAEWKDKCGGVVLVKPATTFEELLERLGRVVPELVDAVRRHVARA